MKRITLAQAQKQARKAPKYVIKICEGFYLNDAMDDATTDTAKALQYSVGFDNEAMKQQYWTAYFQTPVKIKYL